jgi:hypothetical protein|tara:strand:+ start:1284 stop:2246 length:963 start_codon:yes stop_codon:yes gene_type:complete
MAYNQSDENFAQSSGSNFANNNFLPEIYSKKVLNFFRKASVVEAISNTDYAGEISGFGDTVKIINEPEITVYQYERGADVTKTVLTDAETTLIVDTANAFKFIVDDIESQMSHVNFKEVATSSAAYSLRDAFDQGVLAKMFAGVSSSSPDHIIGSDSATADATLSHATNSVDLLGSDGTGVDALDLMARMARLLDDQNVPEEGRYFVAPPSFYEELSQSGSKLLSVDFNAGQGSIRNGLVSSGKLRGFSMYKSNNIASTSNATGKVLAGHMSAVSSAQTITSTEVIRDPDSFGDIVRGLHVYGAKVLRPKALVSAFYLVD